MMKICSLMTSCHISGREVRECVVMSKVAFGLAVEFQGESYGSQADFLISSFLATWFYGSVFHLSRFGQI